MDTSHADGFHSAGMQDAGALYPLQERSMVVLMERRNGKKEEKEDNGESQS
jgi:hypothetical protein